MNTALGFAKRTTVSLFFLYVVENHRRPVCSGYSRFSLVPNTFVFFSFFIRDGVVVLRSGEKNIGSPWLICLLVLNGDRTELRILSGGSRRSTISTGPRRCRAHREKTESYGVRHYLDHRLETIVVEVVTFIVIIVTAASTRESGGLANLIVFLVSFFSEEPGLLQLILEGVHALFIGQAAILENLAGSLIITNKESGLTFTIRTTVRCGNWRVSYN